MVVLKFLVAVLVGTAGATTLHAEDEVYAALLKRQAPGTPSYNCHDNCGTAITTSRQPNNCDLDAFKTNYNNCLQCAGPDNYNIWRMYGNTLSAAGSSCGLSTTPASGKQPDVGPAVHASGATSATPAPASGSVTSVSAVSTPVASSVVASSVSGVPAASGNATASFTSSAPPQQFTNAAAQLGPIGILGAVVVGMMAGV